MIAAARQSIAIAIAVTIAISSGRAEATEVQACVGAAEKGQQSRAAGKLREARDHLAICSAPGCPTLIRRDCAQWQAEITTLMPSVVFGAKDKNGRDLFEVAVSMDGEPLVKSLDGKSVFVDPGPHTFTFEVAGRPPIAERALVKEGEKARAINVTFVADKPAPPVAEPAPITIPKAAEAPPAGPSREHTLPPWILVGLGGATLITGSIIVLAAPSLPPGCDGKTNVCTSVTGEPPAETAARNARAGRSVSQPIYGLIVGAAGLAMIGGGLLWHFLEPTGPRTSAVRMSPWAGPAASGVVLDGSF